MSKRDRGLKKWQFAYAMPELIKAQRGIWHDQQKVSKPILVEYEKDEFDQRLSYAMEYHFPVKI
ncbi:YolD-like family protein [Bacillus sp. BRMEA1]|nr:YolD-like family protein [Neobacillus endophyticus]